MRAYVCEYAFSFHGARHYDQFAWTSLRASRSTRGDNYSNARAPIARISNISFGVNRILLHYRCWIYRPLRVRTCSSGACENGLAHRKYRSYCEEFAFAAICSGQQQQHTWSTHKLTFLLCLRWLAETTREHLYIVDSDGHPSQLRGARRRIAAPVRWMRTGLWTDLFIVDRGVYAPYQNGRKSNVASWRVRPCLDRSLVVFLSSLWLFRLHVAWRSNFTAYYFKAWRNRFDKLFNIICCTMFLSMDTKFAGAISNKYSEWK